MIKIDFNSRVASETEIFVNFMKRYLKFRADLEELYCVHLK